ncbi:MAG: hypothetical protein FWE36_06870 [Erysipelotrichales bacterium]|nr:hypothetical protein [Erysipelotrichales bacterium]
MKKITKIISAICLVFTLSAVFMALRSPDVDANASFWRLNINGRNILTQSGIFAETAHDFRLEFEAPGGGELFRGSFEIIRLRREWQGGQPDPHETIARGTLANGTGINYSNRYGRLALRAHTEIFNGVNWVALPGSELSFVFTVDSGVVNVNSNVAHGAWLPAGSWVSLHVNSPYLWEEGFTNRYQTVLQRYTFAEVLVDEWVDTLGYYAHPQWFNQAGLYSLVVTCRNTNRVVRTFFFAIAE